MKQLILLALILIALPSYAANSLQVEKLFNEAKGLCSLYQKQCNFTVVNYEGMVAQTRYGGEISLSTGIIKAMNEEQLRGVLFHEVGHVVFRHIEIKGDHYYTCMKNHDCNQEYISNMKRQHEYQADRFSTYVCKYGNMRCDLIGALLILTPPKDLHKTHDSHPSTVDRINAIYNILNGDLIYGY